MGRGFIITGTNFKKGFTLVELSIVLVIIGLLIGGILAAQSMIETTKVNSVIRELQQFDTAVSNFQTKYTSWPGDSTAFGCSVHNNSVNVCGNGAIEDYNDGFGGFNWEVSNFWPQLQQAVLFMALINPLTQLFQLMVLTVIPIIRMHR